MGHESSTRHGENIAMDGLPASYASASSSADASTVDNYTGGKPVRPVAGVDTPIPRVTARSLVMALFVSMGGLLFGYDTGQISGFQEMSNYLRRYGEMTGNGDYKFSNTRSGLIVGLLSIGTLIGALCAAPVADKLGRKYSITVWCIVLNIGLIVQISTPSGHWWQMVVGRWVTGLGVGGCSLLVPMYQGESSPRHIRGAMICCYQLFVTLGIFLAYCINLGTHTLHGTAQWRITLGLTFLFALVLGGGMLFFPESPRYDFRHGKVDRAQRTLAKLYGVPENHVRILEELEEIREQFEMETEQQVWHEFITAPRMFYRIALGMALQSLQQLTGANYFFYYGTTIFQGAGISDSFVTQVILGAVNFGTTFGGLYVVENFGRRKSLMFGAGWMFIMFMIFASLGHFALDVAHPENTPGVGKGMIVVTCLFIAAYAMTWGPMIWAIVAELFPSKYRAKGMALATASNWAWNFLISFFTPFITSAIDFAYGYVFAGCLLAGIFVIYFFVIEGKGRTLEELDYMYVHKVAPWKSSKYEFPQQSSEWQPAETSTGRKDREMQHAENA
ncbi:MFS-type Sugar/inositol transporter [Penicillium ucsense]|uniref:MFS-type Sugar/inositol transporter n=1 Tax=Penicillium ucsense TaxID=2839758 RepID=A0A8J8VYS2_9EURO|nr:MFS-type Sugar/inositol transporter [Penicillium ucsense]KAF7733485.1 MFS-type Sugar/inositol transporter [Penicillium ucsense]